MDQLMFHQYLYGYFMVALEIHQNGSNMFKPITKNHEGLWRGRGKQTTTKNGFPHLYKSQRPKCQPFPNPKISLIAGSWLAQIDARPLTKKSGDFSQLSPIQIPILPFENTVNPKLVPLKPSPDDIPTHNHMLVHHLPSSSKLFLFSKMMKYGQIAP